MNGEGKEALRVAFGRGKWSRSDWIVMKGPRWNYVKEFVQKEDHIQNDCPDVPDEELYSRYVTDVYTSMVYAKTFTAKAEIASVMSFDHLMAPLILVAPRIGRDAAGRPELWEHHEVVLYNEGINVWHYEWVDSAPKWHLAAFLRVPFEAGRKYDLKVTLEKRRGQMQLDVDCGGHHFGYQDEKLPETFYAGITGCEGRNRFCNFRVRTDLPALDMSADGDRP